MKNLVTIFLLLSSIGVAAQNVEQKRKEMLGNRYAETELKKALTEKADSKITTGEKQIELNDSLLAIKTAEKFLFKKYGKSVIQSQKPYEVYLIKNYWVIFGNYFKNESFLIILDKRNATIVKHKMRKLE